MLDNQKYMCYITYAIALDKMPELPDILPHAQAVSMPEAPENVHPPGFVMKWFQDSSYPEDDVD